MFGFGTDPSMTGAEKLQIIGATLRDLGNPTSNALGPLASSLDARRQKLIQQALAQQAAAAVGSGGLRAGVQALAPLQAQGLDTTPYLKLLEAGNPNRQVANGIAYDPQGVQPGERIGVNLQNVNGFLKDLQDPTNANQFVPDLPQGMMPNGQGGVANISGFIPAMSAQEAAKAGAQAAGAAPYDFINVPTPTGAPEVRSKATAAGGVFTGQSPAAAALANQQAQNKAARLNTYQAAVDADQKVLPLLDQMESLLNNGSVITGQAADWRLQMARSLALAGNQDAAKSVADTETYQNLTSRQVLPLVKALGSGNGITDADRKFTQDIVAGRISLNKDTMTRVIDIGRKQAQFNAAQLAKAKGDASGITPEQARAELAKRRGLR